MSTDHRSTALERLGELRGRLEQLDGTDHDTLVSECDLLIKAVEAFHMEGIRFRMYGLHRRLTSDTAVVPVDVVHILETARTSLGAAGFKTK